MSTRLLRSLGYFVSTRQHHVLVKTYTSGGDDLHPLLQPNPLCVVCSVHCRRFNYLPVVYRKLVVPHWDLTSIMNSSSSSSSFRIGALDDLGLGQGLLFPWNRNRVLRDYHNFAGRHLRTYGITWSLIPVVSVGAVLLVCGASERFTILFSLYTYYAAYSPNILVWAA